MRKTKVFLKLEEKFKNVTNTRELVNFLTFCPICGELSIEESVAIDEYSYLCFRCGGFKISGSLYSEIGNYSMDDRLLLSSYIRQLFESSGEATRLNSYSFKDLLLQARATTVSPTEKVSLFLIGLDKISSYFGEAFDLVGLNLREFNGRRPIIELIEKIRGSIPTITYAFDNYTGSSKEIDVRAVLKMVMLYYYLESLPYITNVREFTSIVKELLKNNLVTIGQKEPYEGDNFLFLGGLSLTLDGAQLVEKYRFTHSKLSSKAFVAIDFSKDYDNVYEVIKSAIEKAGFGSLRADKVHYSDYAMDWILNRIKESRFVVAELTPKEAISGRVSKEKQKKTYGNPGVYFEAGYARGYGIPVITCIRRIKDEDGQDITFENIHFDLRQYNTIVYDSPEELQRKIYERIINIVGYGPLYKEE